MADDLSLKSGHGSYWRIQNVSSSGVRQKNPEDGRAIKQRFGEAGGVSCGVNKSLARQATFLPKLVSRAYLTFARYSCANRSQNCLPALRRLGKKKSREIEAEMVTDFRPSGGDIQRRESEWQVNEGHGTVCCS